MALAQFVKRLSWSDLRGCAVSDEEAWVMSKRKLTAVCSHQTRIGNLDAHLI
ncbi:hypothetical protein [Escherichia coli]|uniref:DUF7706 family protein n=1 Tax=Escherichia coli TaxID=562 RepID=UPI001929C774|nr:hypothetical protein [Escherichia coli]